MSRKDIQHIQLSKETSTTNTPTVNTFTTSEGIEIKSSYVK